MTPGTGQKGASQRGQFSETSSLADLPQRRGGKRCPLERSISEMPLRRAERPAELSAGGSERTRLRGLQGDVTGSLPPLTRCPPHPRTIRAAEGGTRRSRNAPNPSSSPLLFYYYYGGKTHITELTM